ncbi:glycosyltransferase [Thiolapillus sp.]
MSETRPLKGAYIARLNLEDEHLLGVANKIRAQVDVLGEAPAEVDLYYLRGNELRMNGKLWQRWGDSTFWRRIAYYFLFYPFLSAHLTGLDFIYIRYQGCSPVFLHMLKKLKARNPGLLVLVEIPSYPYDREKTSLREYLLGAVDRLSRRWMRKHVDRIVTFSEKSFIFGVPTICTDNGVDLEQIPLVDKPGDTDRFRLIGVANLAFWHGYDRVIKGLARYYRNGGDKDVVFSIVGIGKERQNLQALALRENVADRVEFPGACYGGVLQELFKKSQMAVSCLGMHRRDTVTSDLKSREYCARGIPFVLGYADPDFLPDFPFSLRVPATDEPLDIGDVLAFYEQLLNEHPRYPMEMRQYAEKYLGWRNKMRPVMRLLTNALGQRA